jgi:chromosome segregation protein
LLRWAIDRYREDKQGPLLKRAGEIFAILTRGSFDRLIADFEEKTPRLKGCRGSGQLVEVDGMSEGTRDQLYLALRLAALELQLDHGRALPFVADDLFINFDDERSAAGFEALAELATQTQVIFLTHHRHLLPIVEATIGGPVNVVSL